MRWCHARQIIVTLVWLCLAFMLSLQFWSSGSGLCLNMSALLSCMNMRQKCVTAPPPTAQHCCAGGTHVICGFSVAHCSCTWIRNNFTASMVLMSAVKTDRGALPCVCVCVCVLDKVRAYLEGEDMEYPLLQHRFLWVLSGSRLFPGKGFIFYFFHPLCPFCLFLSVRVFRLVCILYTHRTLTISCYPRTLCTGSGFACSRSQLSDKLPPPHPPLLQPFPFLLERCVPHPKNPAVSVTFCCALIVSTTAVRGVQGAAGELCPSRGCSFADWETMEEAGRGCRGNGSQRARQAAASPRDPGLSSQPWLFQQEVPSLLQMPRWPLHREFSST